MRTRLLVVSALALFTLGCGESPTAAAPDAELDIQPLKSVIGDPDPTGAIVLNKGEASEPFTGTCNFSGRVTTDVTLVRAPNGNALLSCHWADFPGVNTQKAITIKDFNCFLNFFGSSTTTKSKFTYNKGGGANMHCTFKG